MSPIVPPPPPLRRKSWIRRLLACVAGLAFAALVAELCVRIGIAWLVIVAAEMLTGPGRNC